jgi:hypothetical protein
LYAKNVAVQPQGLKIFVNRISCKGIRLFRMIELAKWGRRRPFACDPLVHSGG